MSIDGTVLVTGATGFVGRHLVQLLADTGVPVRALVRRDDAVVDSRAECVHVPDWTDRGMLLRAMTGVTSVVHLAARVHVMREHDPDPDAAFYRANVDVTRALIEAGVEAGIRRFALASSVKVMGEMAESRPWSEEMRPQPDDAYGRSKLSAEQALLTMAQRHDIHAVVLRLPLVYGEGMKGNMLQLFRAVHGGTPLPLGAVRNKRSLVYVGNVASAFVSTLASPAARGRVFFVSDGQDISSPELVRHVARALGCQARLLPIPAAWLLAAGHVADLCGHVRTMPFSHAAAIRLVGSLTVDSRALRMTTGFQPPYTLDAGLQRTARWFLRTYAEGV